MSTEEATIPMFVTCEHFERFLANDGRSKLQKVAEYRNTLLYRLVDFSKLPYPKCFVCKNPDTSLHVCLECVFFGCKRNNHAQRHTHDKGHNMYMMFSAGTLFCAVCDMTLINPVFIEISQAEKQKAMEERAKLGRKRGMCLGDLRLDYKESSADSEAITKYGSRVKVSRYTQGLRGLNNMGNTCFMNCVLQSLAHNPLLRNYFLGDMHNPKSCSLSISEGDVKSNCMACALDTLYTQLYSGQKVPYTPSDFLHKMWRLWDRLAGYEQQDAHEFFISVLDSLHSHNQGTMANCNCIIHKVFGGDLRSDVICTKCNNVSTVVDPFFDISLDLSSSYHGDLSGIEQASHNFNSLGDCLDRFTKPEQLDMDMKLKCEKCMCIRESVKQLSLRTLPLVLALHLKRFETDANGRQFSKIQRFISFPIVLDVRPYIASSIIDRRQQTKAPSKSGQQSSESEYFYELFSVISHKGGMHKGHYVSYVRKDYFWFRCDDSVITPASVEEVLSVEAYILFYIQKTYTFTGEAQ